MHCRVYKQYGRLSSCAYGFSKGLRSHRGHLCITGDKKELLVGAQIGGDQRRRFARKIQSSTPGTQPQRISIVRNKEMSRSIVIALLNWTQSYKKYLPSSLRLQILGGFGGAVTVKASKRLRPHPGELLRSGLKQQEHLPPPATFVGKHYKLQNLQDGETFPSTTLGTVVQLQTAPAITPTEAILSDLTRTACYNDFLPLSCRASNRGPRFLLGRPSR